MRYSVYTSPFGRIFVSATDYGICRLGWNVDEYVKNLKASLQRVKEISPGFGESLSLYFSGYKENFNYPLDLSSLPLFTREVLYKVKEIPYGKTSTYREIATLLGKPNAQRAVGNAVGRNPIPIVVPCHRVVAKGSIGGYGPGVGMKLWLLLLERTGVFCELTSVIKRLRQECPWDKVQTHKSLIPYIREECEEVVNAIENGKELKEELGDLFLQVLMHSEMAEDFNILDVCEVLINKLKIRHPHIFGIRTANTPEDVIAIWEEVKRNN
jgi:O-6-methylguanine DNA methyltransferase